MIFRILFILFSAISITVYLYAQATLSGEQKLLWSVLLGSSLAASLIGVEYLLRQLSPHQILSWLIGLPMGYGIGSILSLFLDILFIKGPVASALEPQTIHILEISVFIVGAYLGIIGVNKILSALCLDTLFIRNSAPLVKSPLQAGEIAKIKIQRSGKEPKQGIGYLEDGTMVVVNGGGDYVGETIPIYVLSVKNTSSGRIIFCNATEDMSLCPESAGR